MAGGQESREHMQTGNYLFSSGSPRKYPVGVVLTSQELACWDLEFRLVLIQFPCQGSEVYARILEKAQD